MDEAQFTLSMPENEPVLDYRPGSPERADLQAALARTAAEEIEIPLVIGGEEVRTGNLGQAVMPHDHGHLLARYHRAGEKEVARAVAEARKAWKRWSALPWPERVSVFLKAAELLSGPWRARINAATILNQSKSVHQAEIDAAAELVDFFRFNAHFMDRIYKEQPASALGTWDRLEWRPLEGFIFAVSPFNFTSIAGNLAGAPAMMGNTVLWKPASSAILSGWKIFQLLQEAGLPAGVINFLPGSGREVGGPVVASPDLAGIHFTGSTATFQGIWQEIGRGIDRYHTYPRIVGETGGKDFIVAHPSADPPTLATALVRGAFEYQGQKCSAASRAYIPESLWPVVKEETLARLEQVTMGDPADFRTFYGALIDRSAYNRVSGYIDFAARSEETDIIAGGGRDDSKGFFIEPTLVVTRNPKHRLMEEEIFGPVLTFYIFPDEQWEETLALVDGTSPYALTGAVFARDREAIHRAHRVLRHAAGNFYVNDKPTGAVVGLQPFGGSRASGTNDKAGSMLNLLRWVTPRTIKENFVPPSDIAYPHMGE